jgi:hypothetical protein
MKHGDFVESIYFGNECGLHTDKKRVLVYSKEFFGDRWEAWVLEKDRETGKELSRHNIRYLLAIYLKPEDTEQQKEEKE